MDKGAAAGTVCSECDSVDVIIKKARKSYCRNCWKYQCEFRFRKRLFEFGRPAKGTVGEVFRPAEQVLICYDGSPSSVALINLALNALVFGRSQQGDGNSSKLPFPFKFVIFVVLESELNGSPGVEGRQKQHLHSLLRWTRYAAEISGGIQFPLLASCVEMSLKEYKDSGGNDDVVVVKLSSTENSSCSNPVSEDENVDKLKSSDIDGLALPFNSVYDNQLSELRKSLKTKTEDKDFLNILKRNLLHTVAHQLNITKILLPEDQTSLAVKMFSMMSLGRGCQVADEMSFTSNVLNGVALARPFVDLSDDDLRAYLQTLGDNCTDGIVGKGTKRKMKIDSVERQCDDFITNLQRGYPATVSTLTRIGSKLQSTHIGSGNLSCTFCKRQNDSDESELCYGCQHFLIDAHPEKKGHFKNLLGLGNSVVSNNILS